ncbi:MAG: DUF4384 domain-containing protein [Deltaproteobacteria bacterium]|nr:DUF4384 domain-containing protein [Deltaproteobacteria bacterium]
MTIIRTVVCLLLSINLILPSPARAFLGFGSSSETSPSTYATLAEMADAMAGEMKAGHAGMGLKLYLDREDVREDREARCVPFAGMLVNELERAFSRTGFIFEGRNIDQADYIVTVSYQRTAGKVAVYLKLKGARNDSYRNLKGSYEILLEKLPPGCFTENLDAKLARLAQKVSRGWNRAGALSLFVNPVVEARKKYTSPFSEYATRKLKATLADLPLLKIIEEKPALGKSATRSIEKSADLATADALLAGADAVVEGGYLRGGEMLNLSVTIKDLKGKVLASAEENIPIALIQFSPDNDAAETLAQIADTEHEASGGAVRIATVKGGAYQVFREGEVVSFTLQVTRPLYLYVYDINPGGGVNLLYPKAGEPETPKLPGMVHVLPEESDTWEIRVESPYGTDAVKVFASDRRLPIPRVSDQIASRSFVGNTRSLVRVDKVQKELASQPVINGRDLVDYYKGVAARSGAKLYESTVYVETRAK